MSVFDLDTKGQEALAEEARLNPLDLSQARTSLFTGVGKAIGMGVMRGGAEVADTMQTFGRFFDEPGIDQQATDELAADIHHSSVDYWTPGPAEVGKAGQVLGGLSEIVLPLMATAGNPALMIATETNKTGKQLVDQGVDAETATKAAVIQGAATAAGFKVPFLGRSLATRMASGAAGNLAVNAGAAGLEHQILDSTGYKELAAQYDPSDVTSRAIDVLSGVAFGAIAHLQAPRTPQIKPSDRAAIAAAANAKHFQRDTAPGTPADLAASVAHQQALETAIEQLLKGEPVSVPQAVADATFHPRERNATAEARVQAANDEGLLPEPAPTHADQIGQAEIPQATRDQLTRQYEQASQAKPEFDAGVRAIAGEVGTPHEPLLPRLKGVGRSVEKTMADYGGDATRLKDVVRGTIVVDSPEQAGRALEAARAHFGEPVGARNALLPDSPPVNNEGYRDIKLNVRVGGHVTELQINVPEMLAAKKEAHGLYEEHRAIDARLAREGRDATPEEAKSLDALIAAQQKIYAAAWEKVLARARNSASDTSVPLWEKDELGNRRPSGTSQARQTHPGVSEAGTPSTSANLVPSGNEAGSDIASTSNESIAQTGSSRPTAEGVDITAARQAAAEADFQVPTGEVDTEGNAVTRSAREILAEADAGLAQAETEGKGIMAAVTCFLQRGA